MPQITTGRWTYNLPEEFGHRDITDDIEALITSAGVSTGIVVVALVGSTGGITTIEYEPGALEDLRLALEAIAPVNAEYQHNLRWHDGNGFSHLRSALLKTSLSVPVVGGRLQLGTWQQVVLLNFDNRSRNREVVATVVGE